MASLAASITMPSSGVWAGSSSKWHIQEHRRTNGLGPAGPDHWPKRPHDVGGFCESIELSWYGGRKHVSDPPTGILPPAHREAQWRSSCRHIEPFKPIKDRGTGTKRVSHPIPTNGLGWTGTNSNFTGPRHFMHLTTSIEPCANTMTASYGVEKVMGMKKFVFSKDMGLEELYGEGERRCNRAATEWSLDKQLQRKIRVENLEDRRNGIGSSNPGDKGYATAEHAPEYAARMVEENRGRGNMSRKVMCKIDASWSRSGADPLLDKKGRRMCDYIQLYCKTMYRKNSMYVHRNALMSEIADMAGEGGTSQMLVFFKGKHIPSEVRLLECGIRAKDTLELVTQEEMSEQKVSYTELERTRAKTGEVDLVKTLNDTKLEELYPASQREGYDEDEPQAEE